MTQEQASGLAQARVIAMASLPPGEGQAPDTPLEQRTGYMATDAAYLDDVLTKWLAANPGGDRALCSERALNSYAGITPEQIPAEAPPLSPEGQRAALIAYASNKRWQVETGGVVVNGINVPTDDRAKLLLLGAAQSMADGSSAPLIVNGVNYGTLPKATFQAINAAVIAHVQKSFASLSTVLAAIAAGTITSSAQIDSANW